MAHDPGALRLGARGLMAIPRQLRRAGTNPGENSFSIPHYDELTATDAAIAVQTLTTTASAS